MPNAQPVITQGAHHRFRFYRVRLDFILKVKTGSGGLYRRGIDAFFRPRITEQPAGEKTRRTEPDRTAATSGLGSTHTYTHTYTPSTATHSSKDQGK